MLGNSQLYEEFDVEQKYFIKKLKNFHVVDGKEKVLFLIFFTA